MLPEVIGTAGFERSRARAAVGRGARVSALTVGFRRQESTLVLIQPRGHSVTVAFRVSPSDSEPMGQRQRTVGCEGRVTDGSAALEMLDLQAAAHPDELLAQTTILGIWKGRCGTSREQHGERAPGAPRSTSFARGSIHGTLPGEA